MFTIKKPTACQCDVFYSTGNCAEGSGRCECRPEFQAPNCDSCSTGYYDYPNCKPCDCHMNGTRDDICEVGGGQCPCRQNFAGLLSIHEYIQYTGYSII